MNRPTQDDPRAIAAARSALESRPTLAGAGQSIMVSFGLSEATARRLQAEEVVRRKRVAV